MSAEHERRPPAGPSLEFELEYLFDDDSAPSEVTIYTPDGHRQATEWLTAAASDAVPFEEMQ